MVLLNVGMMLAPAHLDGGVAWSVWGIPYGQLNRSRSKPLMRPFFV